MCEEIEVEAELGKSREGDRFTTFSGVGGLVVRKNGE